MTDLHDKARALLALREKATPGPWSTYLNSVKSMTVRLMFPDGQEACEIALCRHTTDAIQNAQFIAAAHDMADTIRDLLAENERLKATPPDYVKVVTRLTYRAEAAEARLRALCEAEPVAWLDPVTYQGSKRRTNWCTLALIPRPSMEGKP